MNIKQALKKKNKLTAKINQEFNKLNTYNSVEVGNVRPYSAQESLNNYIALTEELIILKTAIHKANQPIYDKIFKLSELKSIVKNLRSLNCTEGKESRMRFVETESRVLEVEIDTVKRDHLIEKYEEEIEQIQDELDNFNQFTNI